MTEKKYKHPSTRRLAEKAADGDYELVDPLDYKIMALLPPEGSLFADLYPVGTSAREISKKLPGLPTSLAGSRLSVLKQQGLVARTISVGKSNSNKGGAWQITSKGKELLEAWEARHDSHGDQS